MNQKSSEEVAPVAPVYPVAPVSPAKRDIGLILAIIFASSAISGSLVFFGMQMGGVKGGDLQVSVVEQAFENFANKQQNKQLEDQKKAQEEEEKAAQDKAANVKPVGADEPVYGNKDATITLIEYSDFECPYCKVFDATLTQILDQYDGKVNWVYRHYPLSFHDPLATMEAMASECVYELGGNDKFWAFTKGIYERTQSGGNGMSEDDVYTLAGDVGVNASAVKSCVESGKYAEKVANDLAEGSAAGVAGTPGNILVNNETGEIRAIHGARNISVFKTAIDEMLK